MDIRKILDVTDVWGSNNGLEDMNLLAQQLAAVTDASDPVLIELVGDEEQVTALLNSPYAESLYVNAIVYAALSAAYPALMFPTEFTPANVMTAKGIASQPLAVTEMVSGSQRACLEAFSRNKLAAEYLFADYANREILATDGEAVVALFSVVDEVFYHLLHKYAVTMASPTEDGGTVDTNVCTIDDSVSQLHPLFLMGYLSENADGTSTNTTSGSKYASLIKHKTARDSLVEYLPYTLAQAVPPQLTDDSFAFPPAVSVLNGTAQYFNGTPYFGKKAAFGYLSEWESRRGNMVLAIPMNAAMQNFNGVRAEIDSGFLFVFRVASSNNHALQYSFDHPSEPTWAENFSQTKFIVKQYYRVSATPDISTSLGLRLVFVKFNPRWLLEFHTTRTSNSCSTEIDVEFKNADDVTVMAWRVRKNYAINQKEDFWVGTSLNDLTRIENTSKVVHGVFSFADDILSYKNIAQPAEDGFSDFTMAFPTETLSTVVKLYCTKVNYSVSTDGGASMAYLKVVGINKR